LNKRYGGVRAVTDASLSLAEGEILGLVGPNGAGKTTLVDLICGVQRGDSGEIRVRGRRLSGAPSERAKNGGLARTFQHPLLANEPRRSWWVSSTPASARPATASRRSASSSE